MQWPCLYLLVHCVDLVRQLCLVLALVEVQTRIIIFLGFFGVLLLVLGVVQLLGVILLLGILRFVHRILVLDVYFVVVFLRIHVGLELDLILKINYRFLTRRRRHLIRHVRHELAQLLLAALVEVANYAGADRLFGRLSQVLALTQGRYPIVLTVVVLGVFGDRDCARRPVSLQHDSILGDESVALWAGELVLRRSDVRRDRHDRRLELDMALVTSISRLEVTLYRHVGVGLFYAILDHWQYVGIVFDCFGFLNFKNVTHVQHIV